MTLDTSRHETDRLSTTVMSNGKTRRNSHYVEETNRMFKLEGNWHDTVDARPRFKTITTNQTQDYVILAWEFE